MELKHAYLFLLLFWNILPENFSELTTCMERLEEYADEESPIIERSNSKREPIQEEITNNSSELLQIVKELRIEMETVKKRKWENSESSWGAKSYFDGKISKWRKP